MSWLKTLAANKNAPHPLRGKTIGDVYLMPDADRVAKNLATSPFVIECLDGTVFYAIDKTATDAGVIVTEAPDGTTNSYQ